MSSTESDYNPWQVNDVANFSFFCCPECVYRTKTIPDFEVHAISQHPKARKFFEQYDNKTWLESDLSEPIVFNQHFDPLQIKIENELSLDEDDEEEENKVEWSEINDEEAVPASVASVTDTQDDSVSNKPKRHKATNKLAKEKKELHKCPHCDHVAATVKKLNVHLLDVHGKKGRFSCPHCKLDAPNMSKLRIHISDVHVKAKLPCPDCGRMFTKTGLRSHKRSVHPNRDGKELKCGECDYTTFVQRYLNKHITSCHPRESSKYKCGNCDGRFLSPALLERHKCNNQPQRLFKCSECDETFNSSFGLSGHMKTVHSDETTSESKEELVCPHCSLTFNGQRNLTAHMRVHYPSATAPPIGATLKRTMKSCKCPECGHEVKGSQYLVNHYKSAHGKLPPGYNKETYVCDQCAKVFCTESGLAEHVKQKHNNGEFSGNFRCCTCNDLVSSITYYVQHYRNVHHGYPPDLKERYECDECDHICPTRGGLYAHKRSKHRLVEGPEEARSAKVRKKCSDCDKTFATAIAWREHVAKIHKKSTPFKCEHCHRSFGTITRMKHHVKSMHQPKMCDECGVQICNAFMLRRHQASVHGITPDNVFKCEHCVLFYNTLEAKQNHIAKHHADVA